MGEMAQREAYGRALAAYGEKNERIFVLDADTSASTLSNFFAQKYPERFINIGIAEPCMVDVGVGLALAGKIPFVNAFAALISLRAIEQIRTCVCYARTNVKLAASYAGVSDFKDGPTHHSITDIALMRALPEMTVIVPADKMEIEAWVPVIAEYDGPVYFRLSRAASLPVHSAPVSVAIGKGETLRAGKDLTIICAGTMAGRSMVAAQRLSEKGLDARVINMASIKPIDAGLIVKAAQETQAVVTAEEHTIIGGLGGAVAEVLAKAVPVPLEQVGIADTFTRTALDQEVLMDAIGLSVNDIIAAAERVAARKGKK